MVVWQSFWDCHTQTFAKTPRRPHDVFVNQIDDVVAIREPRPNESMAFNAI